MSIKITFEVSSIGALRAAVNAFLESDTLAVDPKASGALSPPPPPPPAAEPAKRGRGRPPKAAPVAASSEFPAEETSPEPAPEVPVAGAAEPPAPAAAPSGVYDIATMRKTLIAVVTHKGREACGELCRRHGGPNLSSLDPKVYPALYADAQALLATAEG